MIDTIYKRALLPIVRRISSDSDAEVAHEWFLAVMKFAEQHPFIYKALRVSEPHDERLAQFQLDGIKFHSPFGIAAGLDKNALMLHSLPALTAAGFLEVGTVTAQPQIGNPRPRIARANSDNLINAMGFPNDGMDAVLDRLATSRPLEIPLFLNVGKLKDTSEQDTPAEYAELIRTTADLRTKRNWPDVYVVNVSSPNTPGLTSMQKIEPLTEIVGSVVAALDELDELESDINLRHRLLLKLGADLELNDIDAIVELVLRFDIGGLILTNTTTKRPIKSKYNNRPGGFSGSALYGRSSVLVRHAARLLPKHKTLIATGGIDTVDRAFEMLRYADLIGGYTGLVLQGPHLFRRLHKGVARRMEAIGATSLAELRHDQRPK